eukprot:c35137_g1_i1 orf=3-194(+)
MDFGLRTCACMCARSITSESSLMCPLRVHFKVAQNLASFHLNVVWALSIPVAQAWHSTGFAKG